MQPRATMRAKGSKIGWWLVAGLLWLVGCTPLPVVGRFHGDAGVVADARVQADASVKGTMEVKLPMAQDPGPLVPQVVVAAHSGGAVARMALIDVDGLLLNQNLAGLFAQGENPVAAFREKLEAAAHDPAVRVIVVRINSPGGGVTACDIMAEELRRFRMESGKPVIACLMDVATAGAYYVAIEADWIVAHPTTLTGAIGALFNHYNLQDAMAQLNVVYEPIKSGEHVNMGSVAEPLSEKARQLLEQIVVSYRQRFLDRLVRRRPAIHNEDRLKLADGRVVSAPEALTLGLVDRIGYLHEALAEAKRRVHLSDAEVVMYQRAGSPARSLYAVAPNTPLQSELIPVSYPGLDRSKLPTFLYLWQPDPTILRQGGR
jgi:protease IV